MGAGAAAVDLGTAAAPGHRARDSGSRSRGAGRRAREPTGPRSPTKRLEAASLRARPPRLSRSGSPEGRAGASLSGAGAPRPRIRARRCGPRSPRDGSRGASACARGARGPPPRDADGAHRAALAWAARSPAPSARESAWLKTGLSSSASARSPRASSPLALIPLRSSWIPPLVVLSSCHRARRAQRTPPVETFKNQAESADCLARVKWRAQLASIRRIRVRLPRLIDRCKATMRTSSVFAVREQALAGIDEGRQGASPPGYLWDEKATF